MENSIRQHELLQLTTNPNLMTKILLVSIKDHGCITLNEYVLNQSLTSDYHIPRQAVHTQLQPPQLQLPMLTKPQESLLSPRQGIPPNLATIIGTEQKDTQNLFTSALCPDFPVLLYEPFTLTFHATPHHHYR